MDDESKPFVVESPTRVRLGPLAKELARQQGLSLTDMARHLLQQDHMRRAGLAQKNGES
jgi:hypothetical protein